MGWGAGGGWQIIRAGAGDDFLFGEEFETRLKFLGVAGCQVNVTGACIQQKSSFIKQPGRDNMPNGLRLASSCFVEIVKSGQFWIKVLLKLPLMLMLHVLVPQVFTCISCNLNCKSGHVHIHDEINGKKT